MGAPRYSRHARDQMRERHISESDVEAVLEHYDTQYADKDGNAILVGDAGSRRIKVVVAKGSNPPFVITTASKDA